MSVACQKSLSITVNLPLPVTAYWKLDEAAANVPRLDSVGIAHLDPSGVTDIGYPGLISNCVRFDALVGGAGYRTFAGFASLGHAAGNSSSFFGWVKLDATGPAFALGGPSPEWSLGVGRFIRFAVGSSFSPTPWRVESFHDIVYPTLTLGVWHFFFFFWDAALQQWGYSFDNGPQTLLPTVEPIGNIATGSMFLDNNGWGGGPTGDVSFDEMGLVPTQKLTLAQLAFLYNGGAGRTYPF